MKHSIKVVLASAAIFLSACQPVAASDLCVSQSELATVIMGARQAGVSISKALKIADAEKDANIRNATKSLVEWAYEKPRYSVEANQKNAATDFGTTVYNTCKKATK